MENLISSLQDTAVYLNKQEENIISTINALSENEDKLRSYIILYMLASKSKDALERIKDALPDIEKRLQEDVDGICKQARDVLDGAETRAKWIKDIMDALGKLCGDTDLSMRESELHNRMEDMETALKSLIEKRNAIPLDQLDKEK
mgnify:CR=1 FL=1